MTRLEARIQRLWVTVFAGMIVLAILAAVLIAMLLHIQQHLHSS